MAPLKTENSFLQLHLYVFLSVFIKYWPDDYTLGSKHVSVKITKIKC
jgi:hypothetical protein